MNRDKRNTSALEKMHRIATKYNLQGSTIREALPLLEEIYGEEAEYLYERLESTIEWAENDKNPRLVESLHTIPLDEFLKVRIKVIREGWHIPREIPTDVWGTHSAYAPDE